MTKKASVPAPKSRHPDQMASVAKELLHLRQSRSAQGTDRCNRTNLIFPRGTLRRPGEGLLLGRGGGRKVSLRLAASSLATTSS
jgi:hypothetical protein